MIRETIPPEKVRDFKMKGRWDGARHSFGVGTAVIVTNPSRRPGCVLVGKRKGSDGAGTYALPGGHISFGERAAVCALRELKEETALDADPESARVVAWDESLDVARHYHYITIFVQVIIPQSQDDRPENSEPDKCEGWEWMKWEDIALRKDDELFTGLRNVVRRGFNPFGQWKCEEEEEDEGEEERRGWCESEGRKRNEDNYTVVSSRDGGRRKGGKTATLTLSVMAIVVTSFILGVSWGRRNHRPPLLQEEEGGGGEGGGDDDGESQ